MINQQWYKSGWTLNIKNQSWVEDTPNQINFIIKTLGLSGKERILDLACGFGRHSLLLSSMGFDVVGVDITKDYIDDANMEAQKRNLSAKFIHADIREILFDNEFDVVLNMADGAIGYLEDDVENLKIFDIIAKALKKGGKHFMDVCSAEHAEFYFPKRWFDIGTKSLSLPVFEWDKKTRRMLYSQWEAEFGKILERPKTIEPDNSIRLYSKAEIRDILNERGIEILDSFSDYLGNKDSQKFLQLMLYSRKVK